MATRETNSQVPGGQVLRQWREDQVPMVTQEGVAEIIGVTRQYVNALECGRASPSRAVSVLIWKLTDGACDPGMWEPTEEPVPASA